MANGRTADVGPAARALLALEAIQSSPGISGSRLAARLGVTDRAARRSIAVLRDAGIPVESTSGPYGGYRIGRGARIPPLTFSTSEALGLVMAVLQGWHGTAESEHPAATALAKIIRVLPAAAAGPAQALRHVRAQNPGDAAAMPDPELTATIVRACEDRRRIVVTYRTGSRMRLDPWAVVVRHGRWYLLGRLHGVDARRVLRVDRITEIQTTDETADTPADLDPVREVEDHLADGWTHSVEVVFAAPFDRIAWCVPRTLGRLVADGDERCRLTGSTDEPDWYAAQLAAVPAPFQVVESDAVRAAVQVVADRLAAAVQSPITTRSVAVRPNVSGA